MLLTIFSCLNACSFAPHSLPKLAAENAIASALTAASQIRNFTQATALVNFNAILERKYSSLSSDGSSQIAGRFGLFVNSFGEMRIDVYPPQGFVALQSAIISPEKITAVDRINKRGLESEQVLTSIEQIAGVAFDPSDLSLMFLGRVPDGLMQQLNLQLSAVKLLPDGRINLRNKKNTFEVVVFNGEVQNVTRVLRNGTIVNTTRDVRSFGTSDLNAGEVVISSNAGRELARISYTISNNSFSRPISNSLFTIDSEGYAMRRRLN